jgi:hypothetical protein
MGKCGKERFELAVNEKFVAGARMGSSQVKFDPDIPTPWKFGDRT